MTTGTRRAEQDGQSMRTSSATARQHTELGAAAWVLPTYLAGFVLVYFGERVLGSDTPARWIVTGVGVGAVSVAALARLVTGFGSGPAAGRRVERWLGLLSVLGLCSLAMHFAGEHWLLPRLSDGGADHERVEQLGGLWTTVWVILLGLSVIPLVFGETALRPMRRSLRPELGRVSTALLAGSVLALAVSYAALLVYVVGAQGWKVDYSYFKTSRPGEATRRIAQSLEQPVVAHAFFPAVNEVRTEVLGYLGELAKASGGKLKVESHDRLLAPKMARKYRVSRDGTVVLVKGEAEASFYIGSELQDAKPTLKTLDETVQKHLLRVARSARVAYLTVGHGELNDRAEGGEGEENSTTILKKVLDALGYRAKDLGLTEGLGREVPDDATIVLVLGPSRPFAPEEMTTLERYAAGGGKLLLALDPDRRVSASALIGSEALGSDGRPATPAQAAAGAGTGASTDNASLEVPGDRDGGEAGQEPSSSPASVTDPFLDSLERLAAIAHVQFDPVLLASETNHLQRRFNQSDRLLLVTNRFSSHASVSTLSRNANRGAAIGLFGAGSLAAVPGTKGTKPDFAIRTMSDVFRDADGDFEKDGDEAQRSFNVAAAYSAPVQGGEASGQEPSTDDKGGGTAVDETRVFVLADADGLSDFVLGRAAGQQYLLADVVRWLGGEESFSGAISNEKDVPIEHTRAGDMWWFYSTIFGAPALVLGAGVLARGRRRRGGKR